MGVTDPLRCPTCGCIDTVFVEYNCIPGLHIWTEPPDPDGHPATRPCPGCGTDGGSGESDSTVEPVMATGNVVACERCSRDGIMLEFQ